jgi:hypothetical protein
MRVWDGRVREVRLGPAGREAWIECPPGAIPEPGQYLAAFSLESSNEPLPAVLFPQALAEWGFLVASPVPRAWEPGESLILRGPLGNGFHLPLHANHLILAALGDTAGRLLPLLTQALARGCSVALCTDCPLPVLPVAVEIYPLSSLVEILPWAEYLALDLPLTALHSLCGKLEESGTVPPAQALLSTAMPCAGIAACGACAVSGLNAPKLTCEDGPVFNLRDLDW